MLCFSHLATHEDNACLVKTRLLPFCIIIQVSSLRSPLPISVFVGNMWSVLVSLATKACHAHTSITNSGVTGMILMWIPTRNPAGGLVWGGGGGGRCEPLSEVWGSGQECAWALRSGNALRFLCSVEPRTQLLILT